MVGPDTIDADGAEPDDHERDGLPFCHPLVAAFLVVCVIAALAARFVISTPMWLDEALSVNISRLPIGQIVRHLRHDGHPPLYYLMLHEWMGVFGTSDRAVRALSGVLSLLALPLMWITARKVVGRSGAWAATLVFALSPFVLRYGSETRMYTLLMLEVLVGYLSVHESLRRPTWLSLSGVTISCGLVLWTHYWSFWLVSTTGMLLCVRYWQARRSGTEDGAAHARAALRTIAALVVGGVTFLPWLPTTLYQFQHTGTPWAGALRPTSMVYASLVEFAGGPYSESQILMLLMVLLAFVGLTGRAIDRHRIEVDLTVRPRARVPFAMFSGIIVVASAVGLVTGMAFAPRYASILFPFMAVLVALGIAVLPRGVPRDATLVVFALLSLIGLFVVFRLVRSEAGDVATVVRSRTPSALVITCPDQLGPSVARALSGPGYDIRSYPRLDDPRYVDWVDYAERNDANDPVKIGDAVARLAGPRPIVIVYRDDFLTLKGQCGHLIERILAHRPGHPIVQSDGVAYYEPMNAILFPATT